MLAQCTISTIMAWTANGVSATTKTNISGGSDKHFQKNLISKLQSTILQWWFCSVKCRCIIKALNSPLHRIQKELQWNFWVCTCSYNVVFAKLSKKNPSHWHTFQNMICSILFRIKNTENSEKNLKINYFTKLLFMMFFLIFNPLNVFFSSSGLFILEISIFSLFSHFFSCFSLFKLFSTLFFSFALTVSGFFKPLFISDFFTLWKTSLLFLSIPVFVFFNSKRMVLLLS